MRIKLIAPAIRKARARRNNVIAYAPPYNLSLLAALVPPEVEVSICDEAQGPIDFDQKIDMAAITVYTPTAPRAYEIADRYRAQGVTVVLGGIHVTVLPDEAEQHADAIVLGEAEEIWPRLIADFAQKRLLKRYQGEGHRSQGDDHRELAGLPVPRRALLDGKRYLLPRQVQTTRGCPFLCNFCMVSNLFGGSYRSRPVEEVVAEITGLMQGLPKKRHLLTLPQLVYFIDDNIISRPTYAKKLFESLIPLQIKWIGQAPITFAKRPELLRLAAQSGCVGIFIGFESINPESLSWAGKKSNKVSEYEESIAQIHSHGISIEGSFVFGFDHDDDTVFERTVRFAQKTRLELADFWTLTPYPGTKLFDELNQQGRILTRDWERYEDDVVFEPRLLSASKLKEGTRWAWKEFYSASSIVRRLWGFRPNLLDTWLFNLYMSRITKAASKPAPP